MTEEWDRSLKQNVELTMGELALIREVLIDHRRRYNEAIAPFGLQVTWDADRRISDVLDQIIEARCLLKRRQHVAYNPAGDSECSGYATYAEIDAWREAHPEPEQEPGT